VVSDWFAFLQSSKDIKSQKNSEELNFK
jgi:hypothetical protein